VNVVTLIDHINESFYSPTSYSIHSATNKIILCHKDQTSSPIHDIFRPFQRRDSPGVISRAKEINRLLRNKQDSLFMIPIIPVSSYRFNMPLSGDFIIISELVAVLYTVLASTACKIHMNNF
jgi:hypothetical protein